MRPITLKTNEQNHLELGGIDLVDLAKEYGTPLYVLDEATIRENCRKYQRKIKETYPNSMIAYASKALSTISLLNILSEEEFGLDVVSGGELYTALKSKINKEKILFHGNNKSIEELRFAISEGVKIVIDNKTELERIIAITNELNTKTAVLLRIRPGIEAHTHDFIKTGHEDSKFGINKKDLIPYLKIINNESNLQFLGLHSHIGSQIFDIKPYEELISILLELTANVKHELNIEVPIINLGGGIGIQYLPDDDPPEINEFITRISRQMKKECARLNLKEPQLILEPGRSIIGTAGVTLYTVGLVKRISAYRSYIFIDGGMADNPRPLLYQAEYSFDIVNKAKDEKKSNYTIAGKFCESGDIIAKKIPLPFVEENDYLITYATGAYNYSMSSNYNRFCRPAMVLVNNGSSHLIIKRETYEDLIRNDL